MTSATAAASLRETVYLASFAAGAILGLQVSACSGGVTVESQDGSGPGCTEVGTPAVHDHVLALSDVRSGVFVGDTLHLQAVLDGVDGYFVIALDPQGIARVQPPSGMSGPADLVEVSPGAHARLGPGEDGTAQVEIIDTSAPESPTLLGAGAVKGLVDDRPAFTVVDEKMYFCLRPSADEKPELAVLDVSDPSSLGEPEIVESYVCQLGELEMEHAARGSVWIDWDHPTGYYVQSTYVYVLGGGEPNKVVDYGYNQTGVHQYGNVLSASTSAERAAFDPENASQYLLVNPLDSTVPFAWAQLSLGEPARLLGVADATMYLSTAGGIRAYDITDIQSPSLDDFEAEVPFGDGAPRLLAASDRYLAVVDGEGALFLVPREDSGTVAPLQVHETDYAPATGAGCAE